MVDSASTREKMFSAYCTSLVDALRCRLKCLCQKAPTSPVCIALVEGREHENLEFTILNTLFMSGISLGDCEIYVLCTSLNLARVKSICNNIPENHKSRCRIIQIMGGMNSIEEYNNLFYHQDFWNIFSNFDQVLIVQTDCLWIKPINFADHASFAYVGAPWADAPFLVDKTEVRPNSAVTKLCSANMVGNGGFSLRNVNVMKKIVGIKSKIHDALIRELNMDHPITLASFPEDLFFCSGIRHLHESGQLDPFLLCPVETAGAFASEMVFNSNSCASHKTYCYHSIQQMSTHVSNHMSILMEA